MPNTIKTKPLYSGVIHTTSKKKTWSEADKKAYKEQRKNELDSAIAEIKAGVKTLFEIGNFKEYLDFVNNFHEYSLNNILWILKQNPTATRVASFQTWKKLKRFVKSGEHGLKVIVPITKKSKYSVVDDNGIESEKAFSRTYFKVGYVFDISQTDGEEVPTICRELTETSIEAILEKAIPILENVTGFKVTYEAINGNSKGYCHVGKIIIALKEGMSSTQTFKTLIHECSHALNFEINSNYKSKSQREDEEIIAESVAYTVSKHFAIDTSDYSFEYIANWSKTKKEEELSAILERIRANSNIIINALEESEVK